MNNKCSHIKKTALVSALLLEIGTGAHAANIAVDGTTCSLADAIISANTDTAVGGCSAGSGDDVLDLDIGGSPFNLTVGLPSITTNVTVNGNGSTVARDPGAPYFTIFTLDGGSTSSLNDLTIRGGYDAGNQGGGVNIGAGTTTEINNCIITGNTGGGVFLYNPGNATINNSLISNNSGVVDDYYGGGVSINSGYLEINNSTITGNSNVSTNAGGGGVYVTDYDTTVTVGISNSTISGNTSVQSGGGIQVKSYSNGIELNLNNVTVTLNSTDGNGGGIYGNGGDVAVSQSLLSGNTAVSANQWEAGGTSYVTVDAYNIFGESSASGLTGVTPGGYDIIPTVGVAEIFDTNLTDNGGPTPTHALITNGPAVDVIPSCLFGTDQAGKSRPIDGNGDGNALCDVGAFENENPDVIFKNGFNN